MSGSKRKSSGDVAATAKKCQAITMETKVKIIERVEHGENAGDHHHHHFFFNFIYLFYLIYLFIYLFILGCVGSSFLCEGFL